MFIIILPNTRFDADKGEDEGGGKDMKNEVKSVKSVTEEGMQCLLMRWAKCEERGR